MKTPQHTRNILLATMALGLLLGCGTLTSDPSASEAVPDFKRGNGGKPNDDPGTAITMTLAGAMTGGPQAGNITRDTKRQYMVSADENMTLNIAFDKTLGTDIDLANNCYFNPDPMPEPLRTDLIDALRGRGDVVWPAVGLGTDKRLGVGRFVLRGAGIIQFGGNAGDPPPDVEDLNGNLDQEPGTRTEPVVLRYTGGRVRVFFDPTEGELNCANQDVVTATIASPAP